MTGTARVRQRMRALARAAGVAPPPTTAIPVIGAARAAGRLGSGGTAITAHRREGPRVYVAEPAGDGLPASALDYLLAHELAHAVAWRRPGYRASLRIKELIMFGPAATVAALAVLEALTADSVAAIPRVVLYLVAAWPVLLVAGQMGRMAIQRREELAADRWAARLLGTTAGLQACAHWTAEHTGPRQPQRLGEWLLTGTHPRHRARLAAMRRALR